MEGEERESWVWKGREESDFRERKTDVVFVLFEEERDDFYKIIKKIDKEIVF